MSENEFFKINSSFAKYYKIFEKNFPSNPKNYYKIETNINFLSHVQFDKIFCKVKLSNEDWDIKQHFNVRKNHSYIFNINNKLFGLEIKENLMLQVN
jgi:hypothetical protein